MKLKNKKTGEIVDLVEGYIKDSYYGQKIEIKPLAISNKEGYMYNSLAELNEEWEDYEEPKEYWYIDWNGEVCRSDIHDERTEQMKLIGNYFGTKEEAELAVRKLKAWKRLKDKGFSFHGYDDGYDHDFNSGHIEFYVENRGDVLENLDLLFSGEDD